MYWTNKKVSILVHISHKITYYATYKIWHQYLYITMQSSTFELNSTIFQNISQCNVFDKTLLMIYHSLSFSLLLISSFRSLRGMPLFWWTAHLNVFYSCSSFAAFSYLSWSSYAFYMPSYDDGLTEVYWYHISNS